MTRGVSNLSRTRSAPFCLPPKKSKTKSSKCPNPLAVQVGSACNASRSVPTLSLASRAALQLTGRTLAPSTLRSLHALSATKETTSSNSSSRRASFLLRTKTTFFAPLSDISQKLHLATAEGPVCGHDKEHKVGSRNEFLRKLLLSLEHHIRPRSVHNGYIFQQGCRNEPHKVSVFLLNRSRRFNRMIFPWKMLLWRVPEKTYFVCGGQCPFRQCPATQQSVDQGRFSSIEFSHHDKQEEFIQPLQSVFQKTHFRQVWCHLL
mmetsp:Transcript_1410/g.8685  ORF Transcript_1410/g.8685 Transcript_1410/m.8685 type:complete len:262 (-) Transcript_1410:1091-1876(-)